MDVILKALAGGPFSYEGKLYRIPETTIFPQMEGPRPPIWITAQSPDSVEGAVRRGFNVLTGGFGVPVERMAEFRKLFDRVVAEVKPPQPLARRRAARGLRDRRATRTRAPPPRRRAGTCA